MHLIAKLHDYVVHYGKCPFMVSRKIKVYRNALEIITGVCFHIHYNNILPYILMEFHKVEA